MTNPSKLAVERLTRLIQDRFPHGTTSAFYADYDCVIERAVFRSGGPLRPSYELHVPGALLVRESPERIAEALLEQNFESVLRAGEPMMLTGVENGDCGLRPVDRRPANDW